LNPGKATTPDNLSFFSEIINPRYKSGAVLDLASLEDAKILIISDFHMGSGRGDDFHLNGEFVRRLLEEYYYPNGWYLILNGDIEEMAKCLLAGIRAKWAGMYRVFDLFATVGRLYKIIGNHDEDLIFVKDYPYPLYNVVRLETPQIPLYVYHGHQSSRVYTEYNNLVALSLRYFLKPFGIKNISSARSPNRRFRVERHAYNFSLSNNCISVIGHTHRALFESLGRLDYIKFEIERLCRDYPSSGGEDRRRIAQEVAALRGELGKLKKSELREGRRLSLYGDELPVPCLFNSGSAIGRKGINAIELDAENISLVYWFAEGRGMKFINRGWYNVEKIAGCCRSVLNHNRLDYVKAKIELFQNKL
jgi:predicted phosphodiesterase